MTYALSIMMKWKTIAIIFIFMSRTITTTMKIFEASFLDLATEVHDRKFMLLNKSCLISEKIFCFILIAYTIEIAIHHLKYFMLQSVLKLYVLPGHGKTLLI